MFGKALITGCIKAGVDFERVMSLSPKPVWNCTAKIHRCQYDSNIVSSQKSDIPGLPCSPAMRRVVVTTKSLTAFSDSRITRVVSYRKANCTMPTSSSGNSWVTLISRPVR